MVTDRDVNDAKRIRVSGADFVTGPQNNRIWMNGVNTPWNNWDDFGGRFDAGWWDAEFARLHENGVNATRIWFLCSGDKGICFDDGGYVVGVSDYFWESTETFFKLAEKHGVYVMATLSSFDCFKNKNKEKWRGMIQDNDKIDSYVQQYVIPFTKRFGSCAYLWSIDVGNELDWVNENPECGNMEWPHLCNWIAHVCVGVHKADPRVLVTAGMASTKYHVPKGAKAGVNPDAYSGNFLSDEHLASYIADAGDQKQARLDFYSTHYYEWECPWFGNPFVFTPESYGLSGDRPAVIGETAAVGSGWSHMYANAETNWERKPSPEAVKHTAYEDYTGAYANNWNGVFIWTSNRVDGCGSLDDARAAFHHLRDHHADEIFPPCQ